jgi:hypothetical protein
MTCGGFESTADGGEGDDRPRFGPIIDRDADSQKWRVESERDAEAAFSCVLVPCTVQYSTPIGTVTNSYG